MEVLKQLRESKMVTQQDVADYLDISRVAYTNYENGKRKPDYVVLNKLADYFNVTIDYLLGRESRPKNLYEIQKNKVKMLGDIAAGQPLFTNQVHNEYAECESSIQADYCLKVKGDSMINARIHSGDIVFIKEQPFVQNGDIAAVQIDNEATLKRVYIDKDQITLVAENSKYRPLIYSKNSFENVRIIGKAVAFQSQIK